MNGLSIEQKAERYDEALKQIKECTPDENGFITIYPQEIFPELKESEDERIRKELLEHCKNQAKPYIQTGNKCPQIQSWISWLEKQGEQKKSPYGEKRDFGYFEEKPADKVEPKFHEGEWIVTDKNNVVQIKTIENGNYVLENTMRFSVDYVDKCWRKWDISDAKDGDVLSYRDGQWIFIYKKQVDDDSFRYYSLYSTIHQDLTIGDSAFTLLDDAIIPATKEQSDTLMKAMTDAGWEFDFDKKELKKIEQNLEWNEDDETTLENTIILLEHYAKGLRDFEKNASITWLKDLKNRVVLQPKQEWSEEDEYTLGETIQHLEELIRIDKAKHCGCDVQYYQRDIDWLKSLKDRVGYEVNCTTTKEWSEDDERIYKSITYSFANNYPLTVQQQEFIKSFKDRVQSKREWSEEDENRFNNLCWLIDQSSENEPTKNGFKNWLKSFKDIISPKQEWNEEDEDAIGMAIIALEDMYDPDEPSNTYTGHSMPFDKAAERLKSVKDRVLPQYKEWSEEDEHRIQKTIDFLKHPDLIKATPTLSKDTIKWLKSLRTQIWLQSLYPQNTWSPSEEQLEALDRVIKNPYLSTDEYNGLIALREQLKAL